jgi:hypothetical protein
MQTITYSAHVALLDSLTGEGLLVLPLVAEDVRDPLGPGSVHEAEWNVVVRDLDALGWEPSEDEFSGLCHVGVTVEGRAVVGLFGRSPVVTMPASRETADALVELGRMVGLRGR